MTDENDLLTRDLFGKLSPQQLSEQWEFKYDHKPDEQVKEAIAEYRRLMELDSE